MKTEIFSKEVTFHLGSENGERVGYVENRRIFQTKEPKCVKV